MFLGIPLGNISCFFSRDRETPYWWTSVSSYKDWGTELQAQREILHNFAHIPLTDMRGAQAPNLHLGGNTQFAAMQDFGFEWDGSVSSAIKRLAGHGSGL